MEGVSNTTCARSLNSRTAASALWARRLTATESQSNRKPPGAATPRQYRLPQQRVEAWSRSSLMRVASAAPTMNPTSVQSPPKSPMWQTSRSSSSPISRSAAARADAKVAELLADKTVVKAIVVPGRMVNFVVK